VEGEEFWADWLEDLVRHSLKYDSRNGDQLKRGGGARKLWEKNISKIIGGDLKYSNKKPKQSQIILQYCNILKGNIY
jgi:hypothetical protein